MTRRKKAALHNLGCKVNAYETDAMQLLLEEAGYEIVPFQEMADVYVINTCSVTNMADRKSRQMIHRAKKKNPQAIVVAAGCYVQTSIEEVQQDLAVDIIIGNNQKNHLVEQIETYVKLHGLDERDAKANEKVLETTEETVPGQKIVDCVDINDGSQDYEYFLVNKTAEHTRAFIKVQDGCNQFCSYCIIPYARGRVRSRAIDDVVEEVRGLAEAGYKEIVLTGIHLSSYGLMENYNSGFAHNHLITLIETVAQVDGIERIRLGSLEPQIITEEFALRLAKVDKICPHFHLSLQSGCDATLKRMNRKYTAEEYAAGCARLRKYFDQPAITTDVIVGFPGESEEEFATTEAYLREIGFYEMHIFKYSKRKGTKAAVMPNQVNEQVKTKRSDILLACEEQMSKTYRDGYVGRKVEVLFETPWEWEGKPYYTGYTREYIRVAYPTTENLSNQIKMGVLGEEIAENIYLLNDK
ncbi:MAG: tRNA (N(6)-L-threonylcarbamoyladenosine(37)-C(2))-methylthiotransferase MtaB [Roseburia lenta]|nr:tRNA (N(6)-L-threonylcarbamoyladenosine(37)-C(2))-methylthiotransferase MtaB [Roseburia lenta]